MTEYEDWQGSRWEFTKSKSKWHFDKSIPPALGTDSYTPVCRFNADFAAAIAECMPKTKASSWSSRNDFNKDIAAQGLYSAMFREIADTLGIDDAMIKFHNQITGQMLHFHIDNFAARPERENSFKVVDFDENPQIMRRFAIMLADWELGQAWMFGNALYQGWKAGDCITWEWQDMPHATVNAGWHDRPLLQITGRVTAKTQWLLDAARADLGKPVRIFSL